MTIKNKIFIILCIMGEVVSVLFKPAYGQLSVSAEGYNLEEQEEVKIKSYYYPATISTLLADSNYHDFTVFSYQDQGLEMKQICLKKIQSE